MALLIKSSELPKLFTNIFSSNSVFVRSFLQSWWSIAIRRTQKSSSVDHSNIRSFIRSSVKAIIYAEIPHHIGYTFCPSGILLLRIYYCVHIPTSIPQQRRQRTRHLLCSLYHKDHYRRKPPHPVALPSICNRRLQRCACRMQY